MTPVDLRGCLLTRIVGCAPTRGGFRPQTPAFSRPCADENVARTSVRAAAHPGRVTASRAHRTGSRDLAIELDELEVLATPSPASLPPTRMREVLARALGTLDSALRSHFAFEEQDGYMREVVAARPALARKVTALRDQHASLRERVQQLLTRIGDGHLEPLQREIVELVVDLRAHEDAERDLVEGALEDDLAALD